MLRLLAAAATMLMCSAAVLEAAEEPTGAPQPGEPYMRVQQLDGSAAALQIAIRKFVHPDGDKPPVYLAGVIHLGDRAYYEALQQHLDAQGLVLFEAAGQPGFLDRSATGEADRIQRSRQAVGFILSRVMRYHAAHGTLPLSLPILIQEAASRSSIEAHSTRAATVDGWDNQIQYERGDGEFIVKSLGSDGRPGGIGAAADIIADASPPVRPFPAEPQPMHRSMAQALGLVFQLDAIDYDQPHFRHSDISMRDLHKIVYGIDPGPGAGFGYVYGPDESPDDFAAIPDDQGHKELRDTLELLSGESTAAGLLRIVTGFIGSSPRLQTLARLLMIEVIGGLTGDLSQMQGMPEGVAEMMKVLIRDRNRIVMRDLRRVLESDDPPASISIFYGAGHMTDLESRLIERLGYEPVEQQWLTAFTADPDDTGLSPQQVEELRAAVRAQMKMMMP